MADAVFVAKAGQHPPDGYYDLELMLKRFPSSGGQVLLCGSCVDARGLGGAELSEGARRSTMDELATITVAAEKVLVF